MDEFDLSGKTVIVTGASAGIGKEIARNLAVARPATLIMVARNEEKANAAKAEVSRELGFVNIEVWKVDLSLQSSIRKFAAEVMRKHPKIHVLVNNAGGWTTTLSRTPEGIETTFATNVLAYHLLGNLLLPALEAAGKARIVNVASTAAQGLDVG